MNYRQIAIASLIVAATALAACHGGESTLPSLANATATKPSLNATAKMRIFIPAKTASSAKRRPAFVSPSTKGIVVAVFTSPYNNGAVPVVSGAFDVSAASPNCTPATVSSGGSSCIFAISVPAGTDDFVITTYDTAPVNGAIPAGAARLGYGRDSSVTINAGQDNPVSVALGGVVASIAIPLPMPSATTTAAGDWACAAASSNTCTIQHATHMITETVSVNAYDASGNAIVTDGWYDANGNPVTVTVSADAATSNITAGSPVLSFSTAPPLVLWSPSPSTPTPFPTNSSGGPIGVIASPTPAPLASAQLTGPTTNQFYLTYNPQNMTQAQFLGGFGTTANGNVTTVSAVASSNNGAPMTNVGAATAKIKLLPALTAPSPVPSLAAGGAAGATYLARASDNTFWITQKNGGIVQFNPAGTGSWSKSYPMNLSTNNVGQVVPLRDNSAIWVADSTNRQVARMALPAPASAPYFTNVVLPSPTPGSLATPMAMAETTDNGVWFTATTFSANVLGQITGDESATPAVVTGFPLKVSGTTMTNDEPQSIAADGDTIWVGDSHTQTPTFTGPFIYQIDSTSRTILGAYQWPGGESNPSMSALAVDPATHYVWVASSMSSTARLAYFNPQTQVWSQEYPFGPYSGSGYPHMSGQPNQIAFAADGSIWVTENYSGKIAHFVVDYTTGQYSFYELQLPAPNSTTYGIIPDPDPTTDSIWFIDNSKNMLYHLYL